ncbi:MAG: BON domain-containing protein [Longimicrobiaceae bacterium]
MLKRTARRSGWGAGAALGVLLALPGCGLLGGGPPAAAVSPGENARIRGEVEARLAAEPSIGAGRVRAEVAGATVALHGAVDGFGALQCAIANAGLVRGVDNVVDKMVLRPGPRTVRCLAPRPTAAAADPVPEA